MNSRDLSYVFLFKVQFRLLKGYVTKYIFLRLIILNQYFLDMRKWFKKFLACFVIEKNQYEVFACFFENTY
jgi:hypothetical protein